MNSTSLVHTPSTALVSSDTRSPEVAIPMGLKVFGLAERYAKRTGKLHRNG